MNLKEAYDLHLFIGKIANILGIIPLLICLLKWKFFKEKPLFWLLIYNFIYVFLNLFSLWFIYFATKNYDKIGIYLVKLNINNTLFLEPLFYLNDIIFLTLFFSGSLKVQILKKKIKIGGFFIALIIIVNTIFFEGYSNYQTIGSSIKNFYLLILSILILQRIYQSNFQHKIYFIPFFWICLSLLISILGGGLIDFVSNKMYNDTEVIFYQAHMVVNFFYIFAFIFMGIGCWFFSSRNVIR